MPTTETLARPATTRPDAWAPIRRALTEGSALPQATVATEAEAVTLVAALRDACRRSPWLLALAAADPQRLLRAMGIRLDGPARRRFEAIRAAENWGARPEAFDAIAAEPPRGLRLASAGGMAPTLAGVAGTAMERLVSVAQHATTGSSRAVILTGTGQPTVPATEPGRSHAAATNYPGTTGAWDIVAQLHESFFARMWNLVFASQVLPAAGAGNSGRADVIDRDIVVEGWLLVFIRMNLQIAYTGAPPRVTLEGASTDEVGLACRFTLTIDTRGLPSQPWEPADRFEGTFTRYGRLVKETPIELAGQTWRRTWAADLAGGRTVIRLDDGFDSSREALLEAALDNYFAAELPRMPLTPTFPVRRPLMTYPTSAAFTQQGAPDLRAVTLAFHEQAESYISRHPFRSYILDHGRNLALGISIPALEREIVAELDLPRKDGSVTLEEVEIAGLAPNRLEIRFAGKGPLGIRFSHRAEMILRLVNGEITSELDESTLNLPWYLWVLNALLIVPLAGLGGLVAMGVANIIGSRVIGGRIEELLDLSSLTEMVGIQDGTSNVVTLIERLEVTPSGLFLKGNVEMSLQV